MHPSTTIPVSCEDMLFLVRILNLLVVSLDRIGSCDISDAVRKDLLMAFMKDWNCSRALAECRHVFSSYFPDELGADEMDFLERALMNDPHWTYDTREPPGDWIRGLLDRPNES